MRLAWGAKVSEGFCSKVLQICPTFKWPYLYANYLMACMAFETGETFSPKIRNGAGSSAVGLIQFMPKTADNLGVGTEILSRMTAEDQLFYVRKYFEPYAAHIHDLPGMYMAILMPRYIRQPLDAVLFRRNGNNNDIAYRQNAKLDWDNDGQITKQEAARYVQAKLDKGLIEGNYREVVVDESYSHAYQV